MEISMTPIEYREFKGLFKNFFNQFSNHSFTAIILSIIFWPIVVICWPLGLIWTLLLQVLLFLRKALLTVFDAFPSNKDEANSYRIAALITCFPFFWVKYLLTGILGAIIFVFGFAYDVNNKIMTFGCGKSFFIKW